MYVCLWPVTSRIWGVTRDGRKNLGKKSHWIEGLDFLVLEGIEEPEEASDASWLLTFHSFGRFARKSLKIFSFSL